MNVARLNFAHGDLGSHRRVIENIRVAARAVGQRVTMMGDLPGPKMRIGRLAEESVELERWLNDWLADYVVTESRTPRPLAWAELVLEDIAGDPHHYLATFVYWASGWPHLPGGAELTFRLCADR